MLGASKVLAVVATADAARARGDGYRDVLGLRLPSTTPGLWTAADGTRVAWFKDPDGILPSPTRP